MRWMGWSLLLTLVSGEALAQACVVHSQAERLDVKVCQQNRNIRKNCSTTASASRPWPGRKSRFNTSTSAPPAHSACAATRKSPICLIARISTITAWPPMRRICSLIARLRARGNGSSPEALSEPVEGQHQPPLTRRRLRRAMDQPETFVAVPFLALEQCHFAPVQLLNP